MFITLFYQTHRDTSNWLLDRNTSIHHRQRAAANGSHRAGTIRFQNVRYDPYRVREFFFIRDHSRKRTFAHVLALAAGSSAHSKVARIARTDADVVIVTFRAAGLELDALRHAGPPFFYAGWGRDVVGMVIGPAVDWDEVRELMTESYCVLAPKKLVALVDRPAATDLDDE